jgi:hypothetical protein
MLSGTDAVATTAVTVVGPATRPAPNVTVAPPSSLFAEPPFAFTSHACGGDGPLPGCDAGSGGASAIDVGTATVLPPPLAELVVDVIVAPPAEPPAVPVAPVPAVTASEDVVAVVIVALVPEFEPAVGAGAGVAVSVATPLVPFVVIADVVETVVLRVGVVTETGATAAPSLEAVVVVVGVVLDEIVVVELGVGAIGVGVVVVLVTTGVELPAEIVVALVVVLEVVVGAVVLGVEVDVSVFVEVVVLLLDVAVCVGSVVADCSVRSRCAILGVGAQSEPDDAAGAGVLGSDGGVAGVVSVGVVAVGAGVVDAGIVDAGDVVDAVVSVDVMSFAGSAPTVSCTAPASAGGVGGVPGSGTATGEPTASSTTVGFVSAAATSPTTPDAANGWTADVVGAFGGRSEYVFATARTRMRCRFVAVVRGTAVCLSLGTACSFGTASVGKYATGTRNTGSGLTGTGRRSAYTIGATYSTAIEVTPMPASQ